MSRRTKTMEETMTDYTPSMHYFRRQYANRFTTEADVIAAEQRFDAALAAHDAEVRAGAVAEAGPWESGCFGHCDPEGWHSPCRVPVKQEGADQ